MKRVLIIGNHVPRKCGIATFTEDLADALEATGVEVAVIAMDDRSESYEYPERVQFFIQQETRDAYVRAAKFARDFKPDVISVQHEFGIFGGPSGTYLLDFLDRVNVPVVTTLHTVLREPSADQRRVMTALDRLSDRFVVMSDRGRMFLEEIYGIDRMKIDLIHHGIHPIEKASRIDKYAISTFGLLGPDKGIEHVIAALPAILAKHPKATYHVIGATHPNLVARHGEAYRESLTALAKELGVESAIRFTDRFVTREELLGFLGETSIYITPYNKIQQITSGTLAYAVGTGRVVVSTPYWYAEELLADGRGRLVPPRDPDAIAEVVNELFDNDEERLAIAKRALEYGERMLWCNVARAYLRSFDRASDAPKIMETWKVPVPHVDLRHVLSLTDDTGIAQHATYSMPNRHEGYCLDDNARALQLATDAGPHISRHEASRLTHLYLAFVWHALDLDRNVFRNFMGYDRTWLEEQGSEDSHGRTMWALARTARRNGDDNAREVARIIFDKALPENRNLKSPRAMAFALLGLIDRAALSQVPAEVDQQIAVIADELLEMLRSQSSPDWTWFERYLAYCNAVLPHALLAAGQHLNDADMTRDALESLEWLAEYQTDHAGRFAPVGSDGLATPESRAWHDQQPIEAWTSISAYAEAFSATGEAVWKERAEVALGWYLGRNKLGLSLYDERTGGCYDGLQRNGVNRNQGAESTLSFQLGLCEWIEINQKAINEELSIVHSA